MDANRIARLARRLGQAAAPRRAAMRGLAGAVMTAAIGYASNGFAPEPVAAARCTGVGKRCTRASRCCSGICRGNKGRKTCRAHGEDRCRRGQDTCVSAPDAAPTCGVSEGCSCFVTTGKAAFCGDLLESACSDCETDRDCERAGFPRGSACVLVAGPQCGECTETRRGCIAPCPKQRPDPSPDL